MDCNGNSFGGPVGFVDKLIMKKVESQRKGREEEEETKVEMNMMA